MQEQSREINERIIMPFSQKFKGHLSGSAIRAAAAIWIEESFLPGSLGVGE